MFPGPLGISLAGRALSNGIWSCEARDIRDSATDKHRSVDDTPAGGGAGMVLRADVLARAIDAVTERPISLRYPFADEPARRPLTQARVAELSRGGGALIVCGRFEGIDQRVIEARGLEEVSIGDYVLSGGEIAAMALIDACVRLLPGVMGDAQSGEDELCARAFWNTPTTPGPRPSKNMPIPEVLVSGDHAKINVWRREMAEKLTRERRPDLWEAYQPPKAPKSRPKG